MPGIENPLPIFKVIKEHNTFIELSDGVKLSANIYRPSQEGRFPAIIARTPYDKDNADNQYDEIATFFAGQGFVFVIQDVRGKFPSEGEFYPFKNEAKDGRDTIEWIVKQSWNNEKVALFGFSYLGLAAWQAAGVSHHIVTIMPWFASSNPFLCWYEEENVLHLKMLLFWMCKYSGSGVRHPSHANVDHLLSMHTDLKTLDYAVIGEPILAYRDFLNHPVYDAYWKELTTSPLELPCDVPILLGSGWYDQLLKVTINDFHSLKKSSEGSLKRESCLVIGPWTHYPNHVLNALKLGEDAKFIHQFALMLKWCKKWMESKDFDLAPVTYYLMGKNEWRTSKQWPPAQAKALKLYLTESGLESQSTKYFERKLDFVPSHLVPSIGGHMLYSPGKEGPLDQSFLLDRNDVLIWSSVILEEEMIVTGPVNLHLHLMTTLPTLDLIVKLIDRFPDGTMQLITDGSHRVKKSEISDSKAIVDISMVDTAYVFSPGHQIQIALTHSHFSALSPNNEIMNVPQASFSVLTGPELSHVEFLIVD